MGTHKFGAPLVSNELTVSSASPRNYNLIRGETIFERPTQLDGLACTHGTDRVRGRLRLLCRDQGRENFRWILQRIFSVVFDCSFSGFLLLGTCLLGRAELFCRRSKIARNQIISSSTKRRKREGDVRARNTIGHRELRKAG